MINQNEIVEYLSDKAIQRSGINSEKIQLIVFYLYEMDVGPPKPNSFAEADVYFENFLYQYLFPHPKMSRLEEVPEDQFALKGFKAELIQDNIGWDTALYYDSEADLYFCKGEIRVEGRKGSHSAIGYFIPAQIGDPRKDVEGQS